MSNRGSIDLFLFSGSIRRESVDRRGQLNGITASNCCIETLFACEKFSYLVLVLWLYYVITKCIRTLQKKGPFPIARHIYFTCICSVIMNYKYWNLVIIYLVSYMTNYITNMTPPVHIYFCVHFKLEP